MCCQAHTIRGSLSEAMLRECSGGSGLERDRTRRRSFRATSLIARRALASVRNVLLSSTREVRVKCATRHIGLRQQIADGIVARRRVAPRIGSGLFVAERAVGPCPNARAMGGLRERASILRVPPLPDEGQNIWNTFEAKQNVSPLAGGGVRGEGSFLLFRSRFLEQCGNVWMLEHFCRPERC